MENTKKSNKLIKSKKYKGIYHKDTANDRMYYIVCKNTNGKYIRYKVGFKYQTNLDIIYNNKIEGELS